MSWIKQSYGHHSQGVQPRRELIFYSKSWMFNLHFLLLLGVGGAIAAAIGAGLDFTVLPWLANVSPVVESLDVRIVPSTGRRSGVTLLGLIVASTYIGLYVLVQLIRRKKILLSKPFTMDGVGHIVATSVVLAIVLAHIILALVV